MVDIDYYLVSASGRAHRLRPDRHYLIGREQGADIHVHDALISRRHAELVWTGAAWLVRDLGSRNGSHHNGARLDANGEVVLADEDRVQFGGQIFEFHMVPTGSDLGTLSEQAPQISNDVTVGAGMSTAELYNQGATFSGAVGEGGLLELLQFLAQTRKSGRMHLLDGHRPLGSIGVRDGAVRDASYHSNGGFGALIRLVRHGADRFAFHAVDEGGHGEPIEGSPEGILMEIARQLDELHRQSG